MRTIVIILLILGAHFSLTANVLARAGKAMLYWPFADDTKPTSAFPGLPARHCAGVE